MVSHPGQGVASAACCSTTSGVPLLAGTPGSPGMSVAGQGSSSTWNEVHEGQWGGGRKGVKRREAGSKTMRALPTGHCRPGQNVLGHGHTAPPPSCNDPAIPQMPSRRPRTGRCASVHEPGLRAARQPQPAASPRCERCLTSGRSSQPHANTNVAAVSQALTPTHLGHPWAVDLVDVDGADLDGLGEEHVEHLQGPNYPQPDRGHWALPSKQ